MKVIEPAPTWPGCEQTCRGARLGPKGCGAKLLVEEGDLAYCDNPLPPSYNFTCPECGAVTAASERHIPDFIQRRIKKLRAPT